MAETKMFRTGGGEYARPRIAAKRHVCSLSSDERPHYIEIGERHWEFVQMPGHDANIDGQPWRMRVCETHGAHVESLA